MSWIMTHSAGPAGRRQHEVRAVVDVQAAGEQADRRKLRAGSRRRCSTRAGSRQRRVRTPGGTAVREPAAAAQGERRSPRAARRPGRTSAAIRCSVYRPTPVRRPSSGVPSMPTRSTRSRHAQPARGTRPGAPANPAANASRQAAAGSARPPPRPRRTAPSTPAAARVGETRRWWSAAPAPGRRPAPTKIARAKPNQVVSPALVACRTPPGTSARGQFQQSGGEIDGVRRGAPLVVDHLQGRPGGRQPGDRLDEVAAGRAPDPGGAHHVRVRVRLQHPPLAGQLRRAVHAARTGRVGRLGRAGCRRRERRSRWRRGSGPDRAARRRCARWAGPSALTANAASRSVRRRPPRCRRRR